MNLLTTELFTENKKYYFIEERVTCTFILRKLYSTFKFEYKFTYQNIVVGI